ncbi:MAG: ABC transporter permease [Firmicutes bacterium]|nr:ABC transporter permease [Bacillota bacterium]
MTMNNIYSKLRSKNIKNYYILIFCKILSIVLVTSYAVMFLSPTVQNVFPKHGDSTKQAYLIFGIAIIGCALFTSYASSLFLKYKSKETGILLSLGTKKSHIKKVLFTELLLITFTSSVIGLVLSIPISYGIWKLFQFFIIDTREMVYHIGWFGMVFGIIFCLFVTLCNFTMAIRFINRTNLMDILNENKKSEIVKSIKSWFGTVGVIFIIIGMFLGYGIPILSIRVFNFLMPSIWNITYLLSIVGIYMVITFVVVHSKKGKSSKKYYKNIIPKSMMKFIGKQTVRNMCVLSLLICGALFASFYTPAVISSIFYSFYNNPYDYSFHYKITENQVTKDEIYSLAEKHAVNITSYKEIQSISLIVNGVKANFENNGKITYDYIDKIGYSEFFSVSHFNRVSKQNVNLKSGEYMTIIGFESAENIHKRFDDLNIVTNPTNDVTKKMDYKKTITFQPFVKEGTTKYVISNKDYNKYLKDLSKENIENFVLFNVENPEKTYAFAKELKNEIIKRSSKKSAVNPYYDEYAKKIALEKGRNYYPYNYVVDLSTDNNSLFTNWKYYPSFGVLNRQDIMKNMSVFLLLFIYIAVICLTAIGIISYTRSVTIAINNKTLFESLKRLGANNKHIEKCIKVQLKKIFVVPTIVGSTVTYLFYFFIMYGNSGNVTPSEYLGLKIDFGIIILISIFMYLIYKLSFRKVKKIVEI